MLYENATPVMHVSDFESAKAFSMDVLGFDVLEEAADPVTVGGIFQAGSARVVLHASDGAKANRDGRRGYFDVQDQSPIVARLKAAERTFKGSTDTFCDMREVEVTDPDGKVRALGKNL